MIPALLRAGLRTRAMIIAVVAIGCALMRTTYVLTGDHQDWANSEIHSGATIVILGLVIPTFVALLGSTLLRGEHAPWSWTLARPIARAKMLVVLAGFDIMTIAACVGVMATIFGGIGWVSHDESEREVIQAALPAGYVLLYLASGIGGARVVGSLRAGLFGMVWIAALVGLARVVLLNLGWLHQAYAEVGNAHRVLQYDGALDGVVLAFFGIGALAVAVIPIGVALPFARAAASVPATPRWRTLLAPPIVAFVMCTGAAAGVGARTAARLPEPGDTGHASVDVRATWNDEAPVSLRAILYARGAAGLHEHRTERLWRETADGQQAFTFADVPAGEFLACVEFRVPTKQTGTKCVPLVVPEEGTIDVDIELVRCSGSRRCDTG